jgi:hypothetical protein
VTEPNETNIPEKLRDFQRNPVYEQKVVFFYDILGWKSEVESAGKEPEKLGDLRRLILQHVRLLRLPVQSPVNVSTFSDNVVISSIPHRDVTPYFLREMATLQLMTMSLGFLMRGGITVGDIIHDEEVVFGPALIRAHELESKIAVYPRIVVDEQVLRIGRIAGFDSVEDGIHFLDPFTPEFLELWFARADDQNRPDFREAGIPATGRSLKHVPGSFALQDLLDKLKVRIRSPLEDKEWNKVAWLFDRISARLGVPPARSYPRTKPPRSEAVTDT